MHLLDVVVTGAIVCIAVWYLYRKFAVNKGCSCGSSTCNARNRPTTCGFPEKTDGAKGEDS